MPEKELSDEALDQVAQRFKVLGDPLRLKLIMSLMKGEKNVSSLVALSGASQGNVSRHLGTLTNSGVLKRRKKGLFVYYEIADETVIELCDLVCGSVERFLRSQAKAFREGSGA